MTILQQYREQKGLSKNALAAELDVNVSSVCYWENGTTIPTKKTLVKMSEIIGVDAQTLAADFKANQPPKPSSGSKHTAGEADSSGLPKITHRRYLQAANMAMEKLSDRVGDGKTVLLAADFLITEIENILFLRQN